MSGSNGSTPPLSAVTTLAPPSPFPITSAEPWSSTPLLQPSLPLPFNLTATKSKSATSLPTTAAHAIEALASSLSSHVFVYDDALGSGFGQESLTWGMEGKAAKGWEMQARPGAGLVLLGRLGSPLGGSTSAASQGGVLTAFVGPQGLGLMSQTLAQLPASGEGGKLVLQVPGLSPLPSGAFTPSLYSLTPALSGVPTDSENLAVILSSTPKESVALAAAAYSVKQHIVHVFDHSSARELTALPAPKPLGGDLSLATAFDRLGVKYFDYFGDACAEYVLVCLNTPLAHALKAFLAQTPRVGLLVIRVLRPWDEVTFLSALPNSARHLHVIDHVADTFDRGILYDDVLGTVLSGSGLTHSAVHKVGLLPEKLVEHTSRPAQLIARLYPALPAPASVHAQAQAQAKKLAFYTAPNSTLQETIAHTFLLSSSVSTRLLSAIDAFSHVGGVALHRMLLHRASEDLASVELPVDNLFPIEQDSADFVAVADASLLKTHAVLSSAHPDAQVLINTSWSAEELAASLPPATLAQVEAKHPHLYTFDLRKAADSLIALDAGKEEAQEELETVLQLVAFLRLYLVGAGGETAVDKVVRAIYGSFVAGVALPDVLKAAWGNLHEIVLPKYEPEEKKTNENPLKYFEFNTIAAASVPAAKPAPVPRVSSWHEAAKLLMFRESTLVPSTTDTTEQPTALRPETEERTYLVKCTVNRRLTPVTYDRNVFHLEFDSTGTGLKYAVGEALGIHGWNDEQEVADFCKWYGLDPDQVISVPLPEGSRGARHTRTIFQTLQQVVDLFGKPPKGFYAALALLAKDRPDAMALRFISSAEGASMFKKLSEFDTVTFADVLRMYPSAHPSIEQLVELVGFIKPRHYSIASSQAVVGNRVDLLVVTVDWATPSGPIRYGQCTRYLAALKEGQKVTVSIRPSVMKLPPSDRQPIIMAGLGTGAAPFRAFMQHRAWQKSHGIEVGPLIYYFGSRHRSKEYLYGEEIEAYLRDGVITHAGLAFSRDTNKKVYIQHKMQNDGKMLNTMLAGEDEGVFYLCGPTWPVPDVYEALVKSLVHHGEKKRTEAEEYLEALKEDERYVLEVY
ncbi:hypothetical protein DACRYDRAFT_23203 [Dacryopinax primogenitus]|uniref:assimilatory sulfite reductase (NADPH) n=1 Tax=Dacryopinax primogenitus (strain DJM 731) TaxID=1858805 RepID=M5FS91_DACPD|nr:uncharacterized protein DACRYDRAFT_23203 [Dacryopinax primogenitus]EJU00231.1 hypothetical protein DACRYDRAFT_23203 [Dacryopinax primogenitus]